MAATTPAPWSDTPAAAQRILGAISRIATVLRAGTWQFAQAEGLNPTQVEILTMLAARAQGVRLSWVAGQLGISTASASDSVASLVTKQLVRKQRAGDDARAVSLRLSAAGKRLAARVARSSAFATDATGRLPAATQERLFTGLLALIAELQATDRFPEIRACLGCRHFAPNVHADVAAPHHCRLVDAPLPLALLRLDCPEYEATDAATTQVNRKVLEPA